MKLHNAHFSLLAGGMLAALSVLAACGGSGNSNAIPRSASATPSASATAGSASKGRVATKLHLVLGGSQSNAQARQRAALGKLPSASKRRPAYLNEDFTDTITVYELDSGGTVINSTAFDVSRATGTTAKNATPVFPAACEQISGSVRACDMLFSASPGSETFYVTATCDDTTQVGPANSHNGDCTTNEGYVPPVALAVGETTGVQISSGQTNTFSVTMQPVLAANPNTVTLYGSLAPATILTGYGPCASQPICYLYSFDGDAPAASGNSYEGTLLFVPFDGSGLAIPISIPDQNINDYSDSPIPGNNTDPFGLLPNVPPTVAVSSDSISPQSSEFSYPNYGATAAPKHVFLAADSSCGTYTGYSVGNAFQLYTSATPTICYDNSAGFNGNASQYYATESAITTTPLTLGTIVLAPIFVTLSATPLVDCGSSTAACIQWGSYGYFATTNQNYSGGDRVAAVIDPGSCLSDWSLTAFQSGSNTSGGSNSYDTTFGHTSSVNTTNGTAVAYSMVNDSGYAQFKLDPGASGETCMVTFQADSGTTYAGTAVSRTYQSTGTTVTIFGKQRRVR